MQGITHLTITQLFWDTLEEYRGHKRYPEIRGKIARCVEQRARDRNALINGDGRFVDVLVGIWHCKLSTNPDVVMFYTLEGSTMNLAMVGTHHDYPHQGKNGGKAAGLLKKIENAIGRGHVGRPGWQRLKWKTPEEIIKHPDLHQTSMDELEHVMCLLEAELDDAPIYRSLYDRDLIDEEEETVFEWLATVDKALEVVRQAQAAVRAEHRSQRQSMRVEEFTAPVFR